MQLQSLGIAALLFGGEAVCLHVFELLPGLMYALHAGAGIAPARIHGVFLLLEVGDFAVESRESGIVGVFLSYSLALHLLVAYAAFEQFELNGSGGDVEPHARGCLVEQVDGLVGEEAVGDIAVRQVDGSHYGLVENLDMVVSLKAVLYAAHYRYCSFRIGLFYNHLLETALESLVFLYVFAVFVKSGCADNLY